MEGDAALELYRSTTLLCFLELILRETPDLPPDCAPAVSHYTNYFCKDPNMGCMLILPDTGNVRIFAEMACSSSASPRKMRERLWFGTNTDPVEVLSPNEAYAAYVNLKESEGPILKKLRSESM